MSTGDARPPPPCTHPVILPGRATEGWCQCMLCGARVATYWQPTTTAVTATGTMCAAARDPAPPIERPTWAPPPGAPKKRKPFP